MRSRENSLSLSNSECLSTLILRGPKPWLSLLGQALKRLLQLLSKEMFNRLPF